MKKFEEYEAAFKPNDDLTILGDEDFGKDLDDDFADFDDEDMDERNCEPETPTEEVDPFFRLLGEGLHALETKAKKEAKNKIFLLKPEVAQKIHRIFEIVQMGSKIDPELPRIHYDTVLNGVDIEIKKYVYDSVIMSLKELFLIPDVFTLDADIDGKICFSMRINDAFYVFDRV